jgi:hypothetical protein
MIFTARKWTWQRRSKWFRRDRRKDERRSNGLEGMSQTILDDEDDRAKGKECYAAMAVEGQRPALKPSEAGL